MAYPMSEEEKAMFRRFSLLLDKNRLIALSKKTSEYLALQNQINPHFLYNTLEGYGQRL
ncbi:MAG: sensor histidine kinase [Enterocloster sp.]